MDLRAAVIVASVGLGSVAGVVCAKELKARQEASSVASFGDATEATALPVGVASFPDVATGRTRVPRDPVMVLLATNPYEAELSPYKKALAVDGEYPLLEDPYEDARRFANPYENTVGVANPYVDAQRESEMQRQARLDNPYTAKLRADAVDLDNPYTRRR